MIENHDNAMRKLLLLLMLPAAIAALAAARGDLPLDTLRHWDHVEATGDMNGDGVLDAKDLTLLKRILLIK